MKSLAVSMTDGAGAPAIVPDALHLTTEGVPDPTDEGLLLEPLDDLEPEEVEDGGDVDVAEVAVQAEEVEVAEDVASGFDPVRLYLRQMAQNGLLTREGRASAFPYALRKLSQVQLQDELDPRRRATGYQTLSALRDELQVLFSVLAMLGSEDETEARRAYEIGMESMLPGIRPPYAKPGHWPPRLDQALTRLDRLQPAAKEMLVEALVRTISHDLRMTVPESELLRAICAVLHCPLPPLYGAAEADRGS